MPSRRRLLVVAASALLAGCSAREPDPGDESTSRVSGTTTPTDEPTPPSPPTETPTRTPPSLSVDAEDLRLRNRTDEPRTLTLERRVDGARADSRSWTVDADGSVMIESVPLLHESGKVVCLVSGYDPVPADYAGGDAMLVVDIDAEKIRTSSVIA